MARKVVKTTTDISFNEKANHFERIRKRYLERCAEDVYPDVACAKCGATAWYSEGDGVWRCFTCGARGHTEGSKFVQRYSREC